MTQRDKMRWLSMILFCVMLSAALADPDPKKYKQDSVEKNKKTETLSTDERKFLREVEEKFGVKSDVPKDTKDDEVEAKPEAKNNKETTSTEKKTFPAVIAIEIVNDTDTDSQTKGKRTIDANLGYGYRTNNGYSYSYFGKSNQDKGKFVIYPYSQEDQSYNVQDTKYSTISNDKQTYQSQTSVEIQPSQAYELVPVPNEQPSYEYKKPAIEFRTPTDAYSNGKTAQTLYTTYNGHELSGLSGQFPTVMPNYFVDPTQLIKNPQYQNAGLTQDHLRSQSSYLNQNQRIVPVLVLRVPSSYLKNPTSELYANLPTNYPLSQHLNTVNLQGLVNQYFKKNEYSFAPNAMSYQSSSAASPESGQQHYSHPYVKPSYTQADHSGVQYSAVNPVMARYPLPYSQQKYLVSRPQSLYQPVQDQYNYQYQYVPQTKMQTYYIQPQYHTNTQEAAVSSGYQNQPIVVSEQPQQSNADENSPSDDYRTSQYSSNQESANVAVEYESRNVAQAPDQPAVSQYTSANPDPANYAESNGNIEYPNQQVSSEYTLPSYSSSSNYYSGKPVQQDTTVSVNPSKLIYTEQYQESAAPEAAQEYTYSSQNTRTQDSGKSFVISENYPSKDHTIATVLPYTYNSPRRPTQSSIQTVSYVTPMPNSKYQSQYKIMVPQTVLRHPNSEKVSYVNSQSIPMHYTQVGQYADTNSENEYTAGSQYVHSVASKPSYPKNYHAHPKRMAKPENKMVVSSSRTSVRKSNEKKKSS